MQKIIHQILLSDNNEDINNFIKTQLDIMNSLYPNYSYRLYRNKDIEKILKENFEPSVFEAYQNFKPYSFKADLAKYCLLYLYGGIYYDLLINIIRPIKSSQPILFSSEPDIENGRIFINPGVMSFPMKKHPILNLAIKEVVKNVQTKNYGEHPLDVSGPGVLAKVYYPCDIILGTTLQIDKDRFGVIKRKKIFKYKDKKDSGDISSKFTGVNNYAKMWFDNDVFN